MGVKEGKRGDIAAENPLLGVQGKNWWVLGQEKRVKEQEKTR